MELQSEQIRATLTQSPPTAIVFTYGMKRGDLIRRFAT